jgi:uncharacterized integral membrane protein (TIGR00698 family)
MLIASTPPLADQFADQLATWLPRLPPIALALGIAIGLAGLWPARWRATAKAASRQLIQASVVLLGFWISLDAIARAGLAGLALSTGAIVLVVALSLILQRLLSTDRAASTLLGAGTAICGGSAIAATGSAINAPAGTIAASTAVVFILNAAGVYVYPLVGRWLGLTDAQFGAWCAVGVHDVAGVVAAAKSFSEPALADATVIKLTRVLWIVPVALLLRRLYLRGQGPTATAATAANPATPATPFPWFIALFVLACLLRAGLDHTLSPEGVKLVAALAGHAKSLATILLALALLFIGTAMTRATIAALGYRPLAHGLILWLIVSLAALFCVRAWL